MTKYTWTRLSQTEEEAVMRLIQQRLDSAQDSVINVTERQLKEKIDIAHRNASLLRKITKKKEQWYEETPDTFTRIAAESNLKMFSEIKRKLELK